MKDDNMQLFITGLSQLVTNSLLWSTVDAKDDSVVHGGILIFEFCAAVTRSSVPGIPKNNATALVLQDLPEVGIQIVRT